MSGIALLRRLLMKQAMKKSASPSGIMSLNKNLVNDVETQVKKWVDSAKKQGADIDKMSEQELKYVIELNKPKGPTILGHPVIDATSSEGQGITRDLFNMLDRQSGKNVIKTDFGGGVTDIVTETITKIKTMKPIDGMKEANSVIGKKGKYKRLTKEQTQKILKDTNDHIFERDIKPDPEDFAHGGRSGLNYLLGEDDQNSRVPFKKGFSAGRRKFVQGIAALATLPVIGKYFKWAKPLAKSSKVLTSVPIKAGVDGMPLWFKPLVNQIIKKGDEVESGMERVIVHSSELPGSKTKLYVTQELDTGNVMVDIGTGKHGFSAGHHGQPVRLEYKAAEDIMTGPDADELFKTGMKEDPHVKIKTRKEFKTDKKPEEFWVEEAEFTGGHPENVKFEESTFEKFGEHGSDFSEVEEFATGLKKGKGGSGHMASGGRVPLGEGGDPGTSSAEEVREAWKDYLKEKEKGTFKGSWQEWQPIWIRANLAQGGRVPLDGGGITSRVPYWKGGTWKMIKEAIKHNKIFGLGGPPYKPGKTSLDIKQLTKDRFGTELSLNELKDIAIKDESFSKFLTGFKEYKADVIKAQLMDSKKNAEIGIKVARESLKNMPEGLDPAIANKIYKQTIKQDTQRLKDLDEALKEIDVYKAMKEKTGITSHATGGRVSSSGGLAGMLGE